MAELRLILAVAALAVVGACKPSEAGPTKGSAAPRTSGLAAPAGWRALPDMAKAAEDVARGAKLRVDGVEAWGELSRGCYAAWIAATGAAGAPDVVAERMVASMSATKALPGIAVTEVVQPAKKVEAGMLSLAFAAEGHQGRLKAQIAKTGAMSVLTCFWNQREPAACDAACRPLLEAFK